MARDLLLNFESGVIVMQISKQIDQLIESLNALRPLLAEDTSSAKKRFNCILEASIESSTPINSKISEPVLKVTNDIPSWVDNEYGYEISKPRKPNMREMMEALSGKSVEELYADDQSGWRKQTDLASNLLYGVVGETTDTRDWDAIMSSEDILTEARNATNNMHQPTIDIASEFDKNNQLVSQYAVIKSSSGEILKSLTGGKDKVQESIENFALNSDSVPVDLEDRITVNNFDVSILGLLKTLPKPQNLDIKTDITETLEALSIKSSLSSIKSPQYEPIPLEELMKL